MCGGEKGFAAAKGNRRREVEIKCRNSIEKLARHKNAHI
jgi:hypothetical protein